MSRRPGGGEMSTRSKEGGLTTIMLLGELIDMTIGLSEKFLFKSRSHIIFICIDVPMTGKKPGRILDLSTS